MDFSEVPLTVFILVLRIVTWFYIITILPVIINLILKRIKNKEAFKLNQSIKTYFIIGVILALLFAPAILSGVSRSYHNLRANLLENKVETGIYGRTSYRVGNCMPGFAPTVKEIVVGMYTESSCKTEHPKGTIYVKKLKSENSKEITNTLEISTDVFGYFSLELEPGYYSVYAVLDNAGITRARSYDIKKGAATKYEPQRDRSLQ